MKTTLALTIVASLFVIVSRASAQSFSVDRHVVGGGGGTSTGGVFAVSGAAGQAEANSQPATGGNFSLTGGFWSLIPVQTPGAPLLSIERQGSVIRVFWPLSSAAFVLDQSLTATGAWSAVSFPYATNATDISITVPAPIGNRFFRLKSQ
jgi:hypothetical protein